LARLILDTRVLIEVERGDRALLDSVEDVADVAIAAVTVAELRVGIALTEGRRRRNHELFAATVLDSILIENYDSDVAEAHAGLLAATHRTGIPRERHDLIVAATAVARGREVVTPDPRVFADLPGVEVVELG
jgi:tRNA(fMet)-specific endonuclease VapC